MRATDSSLGGELFRGSALLLAATVVASAASVLFTFAAARLLAPDEYGVMVALLSVSNLLSTPGLAVQSVLARFGATALAQGTLPAFNVSVRALVRLVGATAAILIVAGMALSPPVATFMHLSTRAPAYWLAVLLGSLLFLPVLRGTIQGLCRFGAFAALTLMDTGWKVVLGLVLIALGFGGTGVVAAMAVGAIVGIGASAWALQDFWRLGGAEGVTSPAPGALMAMLRFAAPVFCTAGGMLALVSIDTVQSRHFLSAEEAGIYGAVAVAGRSLFWLSGAFATAVLPLAARRRRPHERGAALLGPALLLTGAVAAAGLLAFYVAPSLIVRLLFGGGYAEAAALLPAYGWAALLLSLANVATSYLLGQGRSLVAVPVICGVAALVLLTWLFHASPHQLVLDLIGAALVLCAGVACMLASNRAWTASPAGRGRAERG